jgi:hypothetical protein
VTISDGGLVVMANALNAVWTHLQLHNGAPGAGYTTNVVGTRAATTGNTVDADGDITKAGAFTGLTANQAVTHVSYWSASSGGTNYGGQALGAGDTAANAAGQFNVTVVENGTAT